MRQIAVYPGTFDPITLGHIDLARRAARLFDHVIVAVAGTSGKNPLFGLQQRCTLAEHALSEHPNISVQGFDGLLVDFVRSQNAAAIVRGLRAVSDFEYEIQLAAVNRRLDPDIETVFLSPAEDLGVISSSVVRELARLGGDVGSMVPENVATALDQRLGRVRQQNEE